MMTEMEGIMTGGSGGANLYAAVTHAQEHNLGKGDRMVVILCDCIRHYLDNFYDDNWMVEKGLYPWSTLHDESNSLSGMQISELNLREIPIFTLENTVGDVLEEMSDGVQILPVMRDGEIIDGVL